MFEALRLKRVQAWKDIHFEFSPYLNAVIGETEGGKSSIVRAFHTLFFNRPLNTDIMKSRGFRSFEIALDIKRGGTYYTVGREKGRGKNTYYIIGESGRKKVYTGFGSNPPKAITKLLNVSPINIQMQDEPYFMLKMKPGERGKYLSNFVNLNQVNDSILSINKTALREQQERGVKKGELKGAEKVLSTYDYLDDYEVGLGKLKEKREQIILVVTRIKGIAKSVSTLKGLYADRQRHLKIVRLKPELDRLFKRQERLKALKGKVEGITGAINDLEETQAKIKSLKGERRGMRWRLKQMMPEICPLCGMSGRIE